MERQTSPPVGGTSSAAATKAGVKPKRRRMKGACIPCQQRKSKCNQEEPCLGCIKRGTSAECVWDAPRMYGQVPDDVAREFAAIKRRLGKLEKQHAQCSVSCTSVTTSNQSSGPASQPSTSPAFVSNAEPALSIKVAEAGTSNETHDILSTSFMTSPEEAETENAVQALEDLALGRPQYAFKGLGTLVPCVGMMHTEEIDVQGVPRTIAPNAYTTILLPTSTQRSSIFHARQHNRRNMLAQVPEKQVSEALAELFFVEINFLYPVSREVIYNHATERMRSEAPVQVLAAFRNPQGWQQKGGKQPVLHRGTFMAECAELWTVMSSIRSAVDVDPAWLATYYAVLAFAASILDVSMNLPEALRAYPEADIKALPRVWLDASLEALEASNWAGKPQARAIQAVCLHLALQGTTSGQDGASRFFVWLSAATRLCQLMGLHRLGSDPSIMPREDPAWPTQPCSLRRELGKRLWSFVLSFDWMNCSSAGFSQIQEGSFDTDDPLNVDDEDLSLEMFVQEKPADHLTDASFAKIKIHIARWQMQAPSLSQTMFGASEYPGVLLLSAKMSASVDALGWDMNKMSRSRRPHHRAFALCVQYNRIMRLHRPFFIRSTGSESFRASREACINSATQICIGMTFMHNLALDHMWFIWSYALGAAAILFIALLEQHDKESTTSQIHLRMLQSLRTFFLERSHHTQSATSVIRMSQQAVSLIDSMLALRSHRLNASSLENRLTDLMNIFNRVAKSLGGPNGAGTLSKQSKTAVDPLLHPFTDAQFQDWLNVTQPPSPSEPPAWDPVNSFYPDSALTSWAPNFARAAENVAANAPVRSPLQSEQHWSFNTVFGIEDMLNTTWSSTLTST